MRAFSINFLSGGVFCEMSMGTIVKNTFQKSIELRDVVGLSLTTLILTKHIQNL